MAKRVFSGFFCSGVLEPKETFVNLGKKLLIDNVQQCRKWITASQSAVEGLNNPYPP